jgi:hypothetical protein
MLMRRHGIVKLFQELDSVIPRARRVEVQRPLVLVHGYSRVVWKVRKGTRAPRKSPCGAKIPL